ncbi:MAG: hypothetical protein KDE27_16090 [Planctomycetes bacterium]|nr:hypothetical protein [Planctomycetota bacterium]
MSTLHAVGPLLALLSCCGLAVAQSWSTFAGASPPGGFRAGLAFDSSRGRVVVFGGAISEFLATDETWEFDGNAWTRLFPTNSPSPRTAHSMAYDAWRHRLVMWGGTDFTFPTVFRNDTWEFDGTTWTQVVTANRPAPRFGAGMAFDVRRRRMVLFGGFASGTTFGDTWEYDGVDWLQRMPATLPAARSDLTMFYDTVRNVVGMWGGAISGPTISNDYWEWDGTDWSLMPTLNPPPGRPYQKTVFDSERGVLLVLNGQTWEYDGRLGTWTNVQAPLPFLYNPLGTVPAFDVERGRPVVTTQTSFFQQFLTAEFVPPSTPTWAQYGYGCAGSAGEPVLSAPLGASPALGSTLPLGIAPLPPNPGLAVFEFGFGLGSFQGAPLPLEIASLGSGCELWIEPAGVAFAVLHGGGSASLALQIPALPAFAGQRFVVQAAILDPQAGNGIGVVTNAGIARTW